MGKPYFNLKQPQPPIVFEQMYPQVIWSLPQEQKTAYLTFDDGPVPVYTPWVLDILEKYDVKATFFCVGENIKKYPEIFAAIKEAGHAVGSHTYNHLNGWKNRTIFYYKNIRKGARYVGNNVYRPPYGKITPFQARRLSKYYKIVMWSILSKDYDKDVSGEECFLNVKNNMYNGAIIVFHDSPKTAHSLPYALPKTIEFLKQEGYSFEVILPD